MKTFLFDTINRYKRFSQQLDVQTVLCNRSWWVFNDSGEKEVYIFQPDGTLIISVSGKVTQATWQYITANESLIISGNSQSYMVHPAFMDNILFALQLDGTNDIAFLIEENNKALFAPKTFTELQGYFENKRLEAEKEELRLAEIQRQTFLQKQKEEEIKAQQAEKELLKATLMQSIKKKTKYKILNFLANYTPYLVLAIMFNLFLCAITYQICTDNNVSESIMILLTVIYLIIAFVLLLVCIYPWYKHYNNYVTKELKKLGFEE